MICNKGNETKVIKRHWFYQNEKNVYEESRSSTTENYLNGTCFNID